VLSRLQTGHSCVSSQATLSPPSWPGIDCGQSRECIQIQYSTALTDKQRGEQGMRRRRPLSLLQHVAECVLVCDRCSI
jgi:hypothetical protein